MSRTTQIRRHSDDSRFEALAAFIYKHFGISMKYIAGIAGRQDSFSRLLAKCYHYEPEVVDPQHYTLRSIFHRDAPYDPTWRLYGLIAGFRFRHSHTPSCRERH